MIISPSEEDYNKSAYKYRAPEEPGFFDRAGIEMARGVAQGVTAAVGIGAEVMQTEAYQTAVQAIPLGYAAWNLTGKPAADYLASKKEALKQTTLELRPSPYTTGTAGQFLHGISSVLTEGLIGGLIAGPVGAAAVIGGSEGYKTTADIEKETGSLETAKAAGYISGAVNFAGALLPPFMGKSITNQVLSGMGINVALGGIERKSIQTVLESEGYDKVAQHYNVLDANAVAADLVLGALFPLGARALNRLNRAPTLAEADAAIEATRARQEATRDADLQTNFAQMDAKSKALAEADIEMFVEGKNIFDIKPHEAEGVIPNPEFGAAIKMGDEAIVRHLESELGVKLGEVAEAGRRQVEIETEINQRLADAAKVAEDVNMQMEGDITTDSFTTAAARSIAEAYPDSKVRTADGRELTAKEVLQEATVMRENAAKDVSLYQAAISCALSLGQ